MNSFEPLYPKAREKSADLEQFVSSGQYLTEMFGDGWGGSLDDPLNAELRWIRDKWLLPAAQAAEYIIEIGAGGGRWSRYWPNDKHVILVDGTEASYTAIVQYTKRTDWRFLVSVDGHLPELAPNSFDYCFSFDTFVHFEAGLFDAYLAEFGRVLRFGGLLHLHYARLWPENREPDPEDFKYRKEEEVQLVLHNNRLELTSRRWERHHGNGSVLVEAMKV